MLRIAASTAHPFTLVQGPTGINLRLPTFFNAMCCVLLLKAEYSAFLLSPQCAFSDNVSKSVTIFTFKCCDWVVWQVSYLPGDFHGNLKEVSATIVHW
jgi:hypothetical protein